MTKTEFLATLKKGLGGLPDEDAAERLNFYSEMIDDLTEEGLTEEEAVNKIGSVGDIVTQILTDDTVNPEKTKTKRKLGTSEITLLALGSPIWISLAVAAFAIVISLYAVLWSVTVSAWAVFVSLIGTAAGGTLLLIPFCINGNAVIGLAMLGIGLFSAGLSIFCFHGCLAATKAAVWLTKKSFISVISLFGRKEGVK